MNTKEAIIRNHSLTLENIAEFTAKAVAVQQKSLDSLAKVVFGYRIALVYLSAEHGNVYALASITCFTWINPSGEAETQLHNIIKLLKN